MPPGYVPEAGDIVWLQFDPQAGDDQAGHDQTGHDQTGHDQTGHDQTGHDQTGHDQAGHDQAGHRPAVVLSPASYNARADMIVCCPTTTRIKGYPFEVALAGTPPSVVLADQVKSQDWRARRAGRKGRVSELELAEVRAKLVALIGWTEAA